MQSTLKRYGLLVSVGQTFTWSGTKATGMGAATRFIITECNIVGYPAGSQYGYLEDGVLNGWTIGQAFRITAVDATDNTVTIESLSDPYNNETGSKGAPNMNGTVYEGVVVQTKKIPAGEGIACASVDESKIVFSIAPFIARDDATASGLVLAGAIAKGVKADDPTAPVEVKLRKFA